MCIAIAQPKGVRALTIEELEKGWATNPDGGGYAYIDEDNRIQAIYSMDKDSFILQYLESYATYGTSSPFMVHMRIATHGSVSLNNCHPFTIDLDGEGEMMFMHNGIIDKITDDIEGSDLTDTEGMSAFIFNDMHDEWLDNPHLVEFIEDFIDYSKLVFLTTSPVLDKEMYILNEDNGSWHNDIWWSNYSCFATVKKVYTPKAWSEDDDPWGSDIYAKAGTSYYRNGVESGGSSEASFGDWLRDDSERSYQAEEMRLATRNDHVDMLNESIIRGDACPVCTGKLSCMCDDMCGECYEYYHACECSGAFFSMKDSFQAQWGARVQSIANGKDEQVTDDYAIF